MFWDSKGLLSFYKGIFAYCLQMPYKSNRGLLLADILYLQIFSKIATCDFFKQYYLCYTGLLLYISTWKYFTEYTNAHLFQQQYEYMTEQAVAIELYGNIFLRYFIFLVILSYFVFPVTLSDLLFSVMFSERVMCWIMSSTLLFYFITLAL